MQHTYALVASMIVKVAMIVAPAIIPGASEDGTFRFIINVSFPSTMLSFITVMFTVLLLVPLVTTVVSVVELKSMLFPGVKYKLIHRSKYPCKYS